MINIFKEQGSHTLETQNQIWEKNNEDFKKMLSEKDEKISHLKIHNQNLVDQIKKSKNDKKSPYRSDNDFEEVIKHLNKIIMDKDDEVAQTHRKLKSKIKDMSTS